jgi:TerC family integral membrane protein
MLSVFLSAYSPSFTVLFGVFLMATRGLATGYEFFAGYLVEQSLSIDNLFVFIMLFDYFRVPLELQSRVLSWGIAGAIASRGLMIGVGVAAIQKFQPVILAFAGILLASSYKLLMETEGGEEGVADNFVMKLTTRLFPNTSADFHGERFFVKSEMGQRMVTPLFLCLVCVELSDFVFAVDSIPAVLGVSKDPLVVYASNIFAISALRSLYTLVSKAVAELHYLKPAVAMVLGFVGLKMITEYFLVEIGTGASLGVVCSLLGSGIFASIWENKRLRNVQLPSLSLPSWTNMTLTT